MTPERKRWLGTAIDVTLGLLVLTSLFFWFVTEYRFSRLLRDANRRLSSIGGETMGAGSDASTSEVLLVKCSQCSHKRTAVNTFMGAPICRDCSDLLFHVIACEKPVCMFTDEECEHILSRAKRRASEWAQGQQSAPSSLRQHAHTTYATQLHATVQGDENAKR